MYYFVTKFFIALIRRQVLFNLIMINYFDRIFSVFAFYFLLIFLKKFPTVLLLMFASQFDVKLMIHHWHYTIAITLLFSNNAILYYVYLMKNILQNVIRTIYNIKCLPVQTYSPINKNEKNFKKISYSLNIVFIIGEYQALNPECQVSIFLDSEIEYTCVWFLNE